MNDLLSEETETKLPSSHRRGPVIRVIRFLAWTSIWMGLFLLGFVVHQLVVTTYFAQQNNEVLEVEAEEYFAVAEITEVEYVAPATPDMPDPDSGDPISVVPTKKRILVESSPPNHDAFAIIRIPTIDRLREGWAVVQGVTRPDLKNGAGHMPSTPLPGQPGNAVISGHRTTYGAPFHELDTLVPGDIIEVETALGVHTYAVRTTEIVAPTAIWVTEQRNGAWLTLTTCNPKFSARQRLVVFAELVDGPNAEVIYG